MKKQNQGDIANGVKQSRRLPRLRPAMTKWVLLFSFVASLSAAPVALSDVTKVAGTQSKLKLSHKIRTASRGASATADVQYSVKDISCLKDTNSGETLAYVVELSPKGFVIVSKDSDIAPVVAYSFENDFSFAENKNNVLLQMLRKDMKFRLEAVPVTSDQIKKTNRRLWTSYVSEPDYIYALMSASQYPPANNGWLSTTWDQSYPYNNLCPVDSSTNERSIVGCVATAMAQILNFHKYPSSIAFDESDAFTTKSEKFEIDEDHGDLDFPSFDELNALLSDIDYSDSSEAYVPALCFACGIIVEMDYSSEWSGAYFDASNFTGSKLGYVEAEDVDGDFTGFYELLTEDMKNALPAMLGIRLDDGTGGHAIVADGWRSTGFYHLNFGWGSGAPEPIDDCWYFLPAGMPAGYAIIGQGILGITPAEMQQNAYGKLVSYPNPFYPRKQKYCIISAPPELGFEQLSVKIYDLSGMLVRNVTSQRWDGTNLNGETVATGSYFVVYDTLKGRAMGKMTILR